MNFDAGDFHCPYCKSAHVKKFSAIHRGGTSRSDFSSVGISSRGRIYTRIGGGSRTTANAVMCAPPVCGDSKWSGITALLSAVFFGVILLIATGSALPMLGLLTLAVLCSSWVGAANRGHKVMHAVAMERWSRMFLCSRCDQPFEIGAQDERAAAVQALIDTPPPRSIGARIMARISASGNDGLSQK